MLQHFTRGNTRKKQSPIPCTPPFTIPTFAVSRFGLQNLFKLCATALFALFFFSFTVEAAVVDILPASSQAHWKQAENQTMALARLMARYRQAGEADKAILLNELVDQARVRQTLLGELVQTDPTGAKRTILPAKVRTGMPDEVQQLLVQKQVLQGELEVSYEDYEDGHHKLRHILKTETGLIELQLAEHARGMQSGMWVRARGWLFKHGGGTIGSLVLNDSPDLRSRQDRALLS